MQFNTPNIYYLEDVDFNAMHVLSSPYISNITNRPFFSGLTIVLIQGNYCGHCTRLKPIFQQIADEQTPQGIDFATIQIDGDLPSEQVFKTDTLSRIVKQPIQGVPMIVKFLKGIPVDIYNGPNEYYAIKEWIKA